MAVAAATALTTAISCTSALRRSRRSRQIYAQSGELCSSLPAAASPCRRPQPSWPVSSQEASHARPGSRSSSASRAAGCAADRSSTDCTAGGAPPSKSSPAGAALQLRAAPRPRAAFRVLCVGPTDPERRPCVVLHLGTFGERGRAVARTYIARFNLGEAVRSARRSRPQFPPAHPPALTCAAAADPGGRTT